MATHHTEKPATKKKTGKTTTTKAVALPNWDELAARRVKLEDRLVKKLKSRHIVRKLKVKMLAK
ncbi:hypothetical protein HB779_12175 [Phyllobacterium sp. 628]|uniref:hypothetical protein n=1 Tax=Phyllobacterium sp. 628 TaxID=2718938 RepID=UPI0016627C84|nr:hypothetical protein [Phyllobacterium sp. 628]QND52574.1 hypothetical protein HB779_12175 [Phyllobacterium sp. 628]